ncbi:L,D-transpeptidase family protein [Kytococcus sedentarius]|uniref:L,D-transpeptidase family protein n=1 Tax=Kytococcus sedentarius TaxID=1276 RepID=UPI0019503A47|nr:L,D-transpeptidase family protein [Kytococcus sedentarius]QRO86674.1 murein L,D-transpeptidase [Kytococcus sedentarius]
MHTTSTTTTSSASPRSVAAARTTRRGLIRGFGALAAGGITTALAGPAASGATTGARATLRRLSRHPDVYELERRLTSLRFYPGVVSTFFGNQTQQAVWAFQKSQGLVPDGVVGPLTWEALDRPRRVWTATTRGWFIEVDLDRQLLMYVKNGDVVEVHNTSTGNGEGYTYRGRWYPHARTPRGTWWDMWNADSGWRVGELGRMWRPYFFAPGGYAIHGSTFVPPYPDSHGCARLSVQAMDRMIRRGYINTARNVHVYGTGPHQRG